MNINDLRDFVVSTFGFTPEEVSICSGVMGVPISFLDNVNFSANCTINP